EQGELPVVCALQSHPNADGSTFVRGQPNSLADLVKGIEAPDGGIGRGVRSVQRYRDRIEELGDTTRVLCQGQSRGQEPDVLAVVLQRSSYFDPLGVQQRLTAREQRDAGLELPQARQQMRQPLERHV